MGADVAEVAIGGLRAVEVAVTVFTGLLVCPLLLTLAVTVAVPTIAIAAVIGIVGSVFVALGELAPTTGRTWNGQSQHEGVSP